MKRTAAYFAVSLLALTLVGCGGEPDNATAGGVSPNEARALDEAAQMIDARRMPDAALRPPGAGDAAEAGPAPAQPAPTQPAPARN